MKRETKKKKLQLDKTTVRVLTKDQMEKAAGGMPCTCGGSGCGGSGTCYSQ